MKKDLKKGKVEGGERGPEHYMSILLENMRGEFKAVAEAVEVNREVLEEKIDSLKIELTQEISDVKTGLQLLGNKVGRVEGEVSSLKSEMSSVKSEVSSLKSEMSSVKSGMSSMKSEISSVKSEVLSMRQELSSKIDTIGIRLDRHDHEIALLQQA